MKCLDCPLKCIGQTGRIFTLDTKNVNKPIKYNSSYNLEYSSHILNMGHICQTITDAMDIVRTHKKGKHLMH
jgi:hypothetical protein